MDILRVLIGGIMLLSGRRLFWLFVALAGFALGYVLGPRLFGDLLALPEWLLAVGFGLLAAVLAVVLQRAAVGLAGFLLGSTLGITLLNAFTAGDSGEALFWLAFVVGGVLGALLVATLFDVALIALSSLTGASLLVQALEPAQPARTLLFVVLLLVGLVVQVWDWRRSVARPRPGSFPPSPLRRALPLPLSIPAAGPGPCRLHARHLPAGPAASPARRPVRARASDGRTSAGIPGRSGSVAARDRRGRAR